MSSEDIMNGSGNGKGVLVAAIVGAAVGAGVALLFAPCSGKETRGWLASQRKSMTKKASGAIEQGKKVVRNAAEHVGDLAEAVSGAAEEAGTTAKGTVRRMHS